MQGTIRNDVLMWCLGRIIACLKGLWQTKMEKWWSDE